MARQIVNLGTPPLAVDGDTFRTAAQKWEANMAELYAMAGNASARVQIPADGTLVDKLTPDSYYVLSGAAGTPVAGLGGFLDVSNTPGPVGGQVKTEQRFREFDGPRAWRRTYNAGSSTWTRWTRARDFTLETISSSGNLNAFLTPGDYLVVNGATNQPTAGGGRMEIAASSDDSLVLEQVFYGYAGPSSVYRRIYNGTVWGSWGSLGAANTDGVPEGSTNRYFTETRVRATPMTGLSTTDITPVVAADQLLAAIGKLQGQASRALPRISIIDATTDLNTATLPGWFPALLGGAAGARNANHPNGALAGSQYNYVELQVLRFEGTGLVAQIAYPYSGIATPVPWKWRTQITATPSITFSEWFAIPNSGTLTSYNLNGATLTDGFFYCTTPANAPAGATAGWLQQQYASPTSQRQEFTVAAGTGIGLTYTRIMTGGVWGPWVSPLQLNTMPFINLMPDSGRFGGRINPLAADVTTFAASTFLSAYNGGSHANGGEFIHDNSTNGGSAGALTEPVSTLITAMGRTGSAARYGIEFFVSTYSFGSGTLSASVGTDSVTRYLATTNLSRALFQAQQYATMVFWVRARTSSFHIGNDYYKNGVLVTANTPITVAEGWVHIRVTAQTSVGYNNSFPGIYGVSGSSINIGLMAVYGGAADVGLHASPLASINELST